MAAGPNDSTVPGFCECGDTQARLAVLGVFSMQSVADLFAFPADESEEGR